MAYPPNSGNGEKFRQRPSAKSAYKPYDRPPTALRGVRSGGLVMGERGGWMSNILDPASRLIADGAAKLFAFLFRNRLTAPLESGEDIHYGADEASVSHDISTNPTSEESLGLSVAPTSVIRFSGIPEQSQYQVYKKSKDIGRFAMHRMSRSPYFRGNRPASPQVGEIFRTGYSRSMKSSCKQNPMSEASSLAEVAKAYTGFKGSTYTSLSVNLRDQVFNEEANWKSMASVLRRLGLSVAPTSVIRHYGIPEHPQYHAYKKSKVIGRFAMHRMSRSPYFKVNRAASPQVGEIFRTGYSHSVSSPQTPNSMKSCCKQALKRGITALNGDYGSLSSVRRIRQKSNLVSPSHIYNSSSFTQKSLYMKEKKHSSTNAESAEDGMKNNSIMLPVQPNERTQKMFQQLDKLFPSSPKEKPSKVRALVINGSPSKLTVDMLHGSALRSMEKIKSSNFLSTEEAGKAATPSMRENMDEESSLPQNPAHSGMNSKDLQANCFSNTTVPSKNIPKHVPMTEKNSASCSDSLSICRKPAFRISVPEDSFDLDDDEDGNTNYLSIPSTSSPSDSTTKIPSKTSAEKLFPSSMLSRKDEKKAVILSVLTGKDNEFAFPIASDPSAQSQPPPTPSMPTSKLNIQKETAPKPVDSSESKNVKLSAVATNIGNSSSENTGIKVGEEIRSEAIQTTRSSTIANSANESASVKSEVGKTGDALKLPAAISGISTASSSEASSISNPINGSVNPLTNTDLVPSNPKFGKNNLLYSIHSSYILYNCSYSIISTT